MMKEDFDLMMDALIAHNPALTYNRMLHPMPFTFHHHNHLINLLHLDHLDLDHQNQLEFRHQLQQLLKGPNQLQLNQQQQRQHSIVTVHNNQYYP